MKSNWFFSIILLSTSFFGWENVNAQSFQSAQWQWAKSIGGTGNSRIYSMAIDPSGNGNLYLTGIFSGTVDFDPGADSFYLTSAGYMDIFILKLDDEGHFQWAKAFGGPGYDIGTSIALDPGNGDVYTTGFFEETVDFDPGVGIFNLTSAGETDFFTSKLDSAGHFVWTLALGGTGTDNSFSIAVDPTGSGDVLTTGYFSETVDFDPGVEAYTLTSLGYGDIFVSKIDGSGNFIWTKTLAGKKIDRGYSIAIDPGGSGDVYISGKFTGKVDFDPGPDSFNLTATVRPNIFISKLNESGHFEWAKAMSGIDGDYSNTSLAIDPAGGGHVYTTGSFMGMVDFDPGEYPFSLTADGFFPDIFISALDSSGHFEWAKDIGGSGADAGFSIAIDPSGNGDIYTTGFFEGTVDFDPGAGSFNLTAAGLDIFISRFDNKGNFVWAKTVTGANEDIGLSVALDAFGHAYVAGYFYSPSISLDSITLKNADGTGTISNIFIAKLKNVTTPTIQIYSGKQQIHIYPNPAKNLLTIGLNGDTNDQMTVTLFSVSGEMVFSSRTQYRRHELPIDLSMLPAGVYFVYVDIGGNRMVSRVVKK